MYVLLIHTGKSTKVHLYWCMKNCAQDPDNLRKQILNISQHYQVYLVWSYNHYANSQASLCAQGNHAMCHQDSRCRQPNYQPGKMQLTHPGAIEAYESALKKTAIYHEADSYCRVCCNIHHCESMLCPLFFVSAETPFGWSHSTISSSSTFLSAFTLAPTPSA